MGKIERAFADCSATRAFIEADRADARIEGLISKLEARVAALEDAITSQESRRPDPNADRKVKWAIVREWDSGRRHIFDRENGFKYLGYGDEVAMLDTRDDAIDTIKSLGLEGLSLSNNARVIPVRVYVDTFEPVKPELDTEPVEL